MPIARPSNAKSRHLCDIDAVLPSFGLKDGSNHGCAEAHGSGRLRHGP